MEILIGLALILIGGPIAGVLTYKKITEIKNQKKLALEEQRFEKIKEILTDGVIDGQPAAIEALKPMVEVIANQMGSNNGSKRIKLEHEHKMKELEAQNEPFRIWDRRVADLWNRSATDGVFRTAMEALQEATSKTFPNLQLPDPNTKQLPEKTKDE